MAIRDPKAQRLFFEDDLVEGARIDCSRDQAHYLRNVLRLAAYDRILVFNGRQGEWGAVLEGASKRSVTLRVGEQTRPQESGPDLDYLFAPLKHGRLDYIVQKATELGVARLRPIVTRFTVAERVNIGRMRANVIEAAEQCGILRVPLVADPQPMHVALAEWDAGRWLVFCDEAAEVGGPLDALRRLAPGPGAVLVGPEGGFSDDERALLLSKSFTTRISLGPRVMRADTAGIAALALANATLGDWA
jgi:16S rRNA (uracil1498-N3)-methyltransferase